MGNGAVALVQNPDGSSCHCEEARHRTTGISLTTLSVAGSTRTTVPPVLELTQIVSFPKTGLNDPAGRRMSAVTVFVPGSMRARSVYVDVTIQTLPAPTAMPPSSSAGPLADGRLWCTRLCINADDRVVATTRNPQAAEAHHQPSTRLGDSHNRPRLVGLRIQTKPRD